MMLEIIIPQTELWDEQSEEFILVKETKLRLEHSLVSIAKWETKWKVPFISKERKTKAQSIDYIRCMTITQNVDDNVYNAIDSKIMTQIDDYIGDNHTATWFNEYAKQPQATRAITSELVYFYMISYNIPFECQKWNFSRLMALIKICQIETTDQKMSKTEILKRNRALNDARRKANNTRG